MRKKIDESRKRKKISTTINNELWDLMEIYSKEIGQPKSRIIEKWIKDGLLDKDVINNLNNDGLIIPGSNLLNK